MIQIRKSVFETNSSSVHSLCISRAAPKLPKKIIFRAGEYGWESGVAQPASYLYSYCLNDADDLRRLRDAVEALGVECKFVKPGTKRAYIDVDQFSYGDEYWGLINQPSDLWWPFSDMMSNPELLAQFLFGEESVVYTGNDGNEYNHQCYAADEDNPLHDEEKFIYYMKGN